MERVAFLIEATNQRLGCLLNPESLTVQRTAGAKPRRAAVGQLTRATLDDDPLQYTGGGRTTLELDLLFDVSLADSTVATEDVRELTRPLWNLAENAVGPDGYGRPPLVRFIWGKSWNLPGIIVSVAEHLEHFTRAGVPQRSWLRMRMYRLAEPDQEADLPRTPAPSFGAAATGPEEFALVHQTLGGTDEPPGTAPEQQGGAPGGVGDMLASVLSETPAGTILASAGQAVSAGASEILSLLPPAEPAEVDSAATEPPDEAQASASERIRSAISTMMSAASSMIPKEGTNIIGGITTASAAIASASEVAGAALQEMTSPDAVRIRSLLNGIRGAGERSAATVGMIASTMKAKSVTMVSATVRAMDTAGARLESGLDALPSAARTTDSRAVEMIDSAIDGLRAALTSARDEGRTAAVRRVPATLGNVGSALDVLWSSGGYVAGRLMSSAVEVASLAVRDAAVATQAFTSVSLAPAGQLIQSEIGALQDLLAADEGASDQAKRDTITAARTALRGMESIVESDSHLEPAAEPLAAIRGSLDMLASAEAANLAETIALVLEQIADAVETLESVDATATEERIRTVLASPVEAAEGPAASEESAERAATEPPASRARLGLGERLDQLAFRYYRNPAEWRSLAQHNDIDDPLHLSSGHLLRIPPASRRNI